MGFCLGVQAIRLSKLNIYANVTQFARTCVYSTYTQIVKTQRRFNGCVRGGQCHATPVLHTHERDAHAIAPPGGSGVTVVVVCWVE